MNKTVIIVLVVMFILSIGMSVCAAGGGEVAQARMEQAHIERGLDNPNDKYIDLNPTHTISYSPTQGGGGVAEARMEQARINSGLDNPNYEYTGPGASFPVEPVYGMQTWKTWSH